MQINCDESKPYIFISYAHKDSEKVYPILERLSKAGFNIWYDKGIEAGSTWDDDIALHIDNASYFMAYVSASYLNSGNCKDEISYARDLNKDMLLIYLEEVAMPSGMAMRLNRNQAVIWNELDDAYTDEDFSRILNAKGISKTLIYKPVSGTKVSENGTDNTTVAGNVAENTAVGENASYDPSVSALAPATVSETIPPISQAARAKNNVGKKVNRRTIIISAIALGIVCLAVGLIIVISSIRKGASTNLDSSSYDAENEVDFESYFSDNQENNEKYKDALEAELVGYDYVVVNDEENKESQIVYYAQINNPNQNVFIENVTLKLTLRGEDGSIITTVEDYYSDILPGDTICVLGHVDSVYGDKNASPEVTCEIFATEFGEKDSSAKTVYSDIEFFNISVRPGDFDTYIITGEVNYNTKSDDDYLNAIVILKKDGKSIFIDSAMLSDVKPGKSQAFSTELFSTFPEFDEIILLPEKGW